MHPPLRRTVVALLLLLVSAQAACGPARDVPEEEVYDAVLAEAAARLELPQPIFVHPYIARLERLEDGGRYVMRDFLVYDTAVVPATVRRRPDAYRICRIDPVGACVTPAGRPSVVLSDISDILDEGRNGGVVLLMVSDRRSAIRPQRFYLARVKNRSVVRFESIE